MKETLLGTVLGDGYLEPHGRGVRLHVNHSERFKSYVDWKHKEFSELQPCNPHRNENTVIRSGMCILPVFRYKLGFPVTTEGLEPEIGGSAERQIYSADQTLAPPALSGG